MGSDFLTTIRRAFKKIISQPCLLFTPLACIILKPRIAKEFIMLKSFKHSALLIALVALFITAVAARGFCAGVIDDDIAGVHDIAVIVIVERLAVDRKNRGK